MPADPLHGVLLDTHAWVWLIEGAPQMEAFRVAEGEQRVAAISVWEVAMLVEKGRLALSPNPEKWVLDALKPPVRLVPLDPEISLLSCRLPGTMHGDPADRLIVATALWLQAPLATADRAILAYARRQRMKTVDLSR